MKRETGKIVFRIHSIHTLYFPCYTSLPWFYAPIKRFYHSSRGITAVILAKTPNTSLKNLVFQSRV